MWCGASSEARPPVAWDDSIELLVEIGETLAGGGVRLEAAVFLSCPLPRPNVVKSSKWRYRLGMLGLSEYPVFAPPVKALRE